MVNIGTTVGCRSILLCVLFLTSSGSALISSSSSVASCHRRHVGSTRLQAAIPFLRGVAAAGISKEELKSLEQAFVFACQDQLVGFNLDDVTILSEAASHSVPGATGRVLLLTQSNVPEDEIQDLQCAISTEIDELIYADPPCLSQPVLIAIESNTQPSSIPIPASRANLLRYMNELVTRTVDIYEMAVPLPRREAGPSKELQHLKPTVSVEVDGAMVTGSSGGDPVWDTSSVLVFDNLIDDTLRKRLLDVVVGRDEYDDDDDDPWDCTNNGPDPRRWVRGGLIDIPDQEGQPCWGLSDEAIDDLCLHHDAFEEFESIVSGLFPQFTVTRLPEAVLGDSVSPMTANAPTFGDVFAYHIDGDPNMTPTIALDGHLWSLSESTDRKPRLISCLVYLNDEWKDEWSAPTRFVDVATDTHYDITPKPGRCVFMDQDITHTVVAPDEAAGKRPRYSLVWKLIFHPKIHGQDMSVRGKNWPDPILLGSAQK